MDDEQNDSPLSAITNGYGAGDQMPLGGYLTLLGAFGAAAGAVLGTAAVADRDLPDRVPVADVLLIGIATHKLTRIVTKDWVTAPIRAPFTQYVKSLGSGEVEEKSRGEGVQRAIGDLLTCQFCTGPWIAGALYATYLFDRRAARLVASTFASVAISDWLHQAYEAVRAAAAKPESKAPAKKTTTRTAAK